MYDHSFSSDICCDLGDFKTWRDETTARKPAQRSSKSNPKSLRNGTEKQVPREVRQCHTQRESGSPDRKPWIRSQPDPKDEKKEKEYVFESHLKTLEHRDLTSEKRLPP